MQAEEDSEQTKIPADATGRYLLGERVGRGGVGDILRAHDTQLNRWVAVKRLQQDSRESSKRAKEAIREAKNLAALQHPNIVTVYDFVEDGDDVLVVMEYLQGSTLQDIGEQGGITMSVFVQFARQTLEGLIAAHSVGMMHRDIKPSNIMISQLPSGAWQVKILDFGLSKVIDAPCLQTMDFSGTMLGSIYTVSPEQLEQNPIDARADIYALGCVCYFALTAQYPFQGENIPSIICSHLQHNVQPLSELRPDIHPAVCDWVMRLMELRMDDRPQSTVEALAEFEEVLMLSGEGMIPQTPNPPPPAASERRTVPASVYASPSATSTGSLPVAAAPQQMRRRPPVVPELTPPKGRPVVAALMGLIVLIGAGLFIYLQHKAPVPPPTPPPAVITQPTD